MPQIRLFGGKPIMVAGKVALNDDCCCRGGGGGGACCLGTWPTLYCEARNNRSECEADGGDYLGDGSVCDGVDCNVLTGACCEFDGTCNDVLEGECVDPAIFHGLGTTCEDTRCEGACATCDVCASSCACDDTLTYDECQSTIPFGGGAGWLLGGNCVDNDCAYFGCTFDLSVGACCAEGFCLDDIDEETCAGFGGTFWQGGISCTNAVACGYTDCGT